MKIIDLLVKIANGEDIPKRIRYCSVNYKYDVYDYFNEDEDDGDDVKLSYWIDFDKKNLNDEIEIIEDTPKEDDKITKWGKFVIERDVKECSEKDLRAYISLMMSIQNEIIDKVNGEDNDR